jgi:hypothetical protein
VLQGILGPKRKRQESTGKRHIEKPNKILLFATYYWGDKIKEGYTEGKLHHVLEGGSMRTGFTLENLKQRENLEERGVEGRTILK